MERGESRWNRGTIFFIILTMARDGPVYGNQIANLISERTDGTWKPSPGSIYPALKRLEHRGFIEKQEENGRVMYSITEKGISLISKIKDRHFERSPMAKLMGKLWIDMLNPEEMTRFIISSAKHMNAYLDTNLKNISENIGNLKEYEVFLMSYELELERALKILKDARKELTENQEAKQ
ncbi:MAG: PadR family transcriptional regulator [Thermoplasmataceae archaeon]